MPKANAPNITTEQQKQSVLEQLWLNYYNDTLYAKGVITEAERNKMRLAIKKRSMTSSR